MSIYKIRQYNDRSKTVLLLLTYVETELMFVCFLYYLLFLVHTSVQVFLPRGKHTRLICFHWTWESDNNILYSCISHCILKVIFKLTHMKKPQYVYWNLTRIKTLYPLKLSSVL